MKSPFEAVLFPLAFAVLAAIFVLRTVPAIRNPSARVPWLAAGFGALGTFTLGGVVPLGTVDGLLGGTNLFYLLQCICTTLALWMLTQTIIRHGGLLGRNWAVPVVSVLSYSMPFFFIDRHHTSATFTHDSDHQLPMLLCTCLYFAGLVYICASLLAAIRKRERRAYWPFTVGGWLAIAGCVTEGSFMVLEHLSALDRHSLAIGYLFFTPLFFPGVLFMAGGVASFAVRRQWRDHQAESLTGQLSALLARRGLPLPQTPRVSEGSAAKLHRLLALDVEVRDLQAVRRLALTEVELRVVERAETVLARQLTVPSSAELWSADLENPSLHRDPGTAATE